MVEAEPVLAWCQIIKNSRTSGTIGRPPRRSSLPFKRYRTGHRFIQDCEKRLHHWNQVCFTPSTTAKLGTVGGEEGNGEGGA